MQIFLCMENNIFYVILEVDSFEITFLQLTQSTGESK